MTDTHSPGEENKSDISVIICVYDEGRWDDIQKAVDSLRKQSLRPREIIISVDHNPYLYQRIQNEFHDVRVIESTHPQGLSGTRNSGIEVAQGSLVAFLDDDAAADHQWLRYLQAHFSDERVLGVGGQVEPCWQGSCPPWFPPEFYWVIGCTYQKPPRRSVKVRNPFGGCTCYRYEIFVQNGGFRDTIGRTGSRPLGCEETELCIRAQQRWPERYFLYEPQARIRHHIPIQRARWSYFVARCYSEGLSKAAVTSLVGNKDGLATERIYTLLTLPLAVARGVVNTLIQHRIEGILQSAVIIAGLSITATGFIKGKIQQREAVDSHTKWEAIPVAPPIRRERTVAQNKRIAVEEVKYQ